MEVYPSNLGALRRTESTSLKNCLDQLLEAAEYLVDPHGWPITALFHLPATYFSPSPENFWRPNNDADDFRRIARRAIEAYLRSQEIIGLARLFPGLIGIEFGQRLPERQAARLSLRLRGALHKRVDDLGARGLIELIDAWPESSGVDVEDTSHVD